MDIGIGLPTTIVGVDGKTVVEWARRAEACGFSTLGTIDRLVYGNYEPLVALGAAAAVTSRIRLTTAILIAPYRLSADLLAKQAATVDNLSDGRLVLGLGVGGRQDDYDAAGADFGRRGRLFDAQLEELEAVWAGEKRGFAGEVGPEPVQPGGPPLLLGGSSAAAFRRMGAHGAGWISGGGGAEMFAAGAAKARAAWADAGRPGAPRLAALAYFALGPSAEADAQSYLTGYYGFLGDFAQRIAAGAATTPDAVRSFVDAFADAGCDELILFPCSTSLDQVALLADAAGVSPPG